MSSINEAIEAPIEALKSVDNKSDDELEIKEKPKRERTEAQKLSLVKAQEKRKINIEMRKKDTKKKAVKEYVKEIAVVEEESESSSSEEEVVIRKKKPKDKVPPKPKIKKKIMYDEVSDDETQPTSLSWSSFRFV
jgi:hypothetical protein